MAENDNGRVTLAVLKNDVDHIRTDIAEMRKDLKYLSSHQAQIGNDQLKRIMAMEKVLSTVVATLDRTVETVNKLAEKVADHDVVNSAIGERWIAHEKEHRREVRGLSILSTIEAAAAAVLSIWANRP